MAATADPRAKPPATQSRHLKSWAPPPPPRGHRVRSQPAMSGRAMATRDRRRSSTSHRRGGTGADADAVEEPYDGGLEDLRTKLMGHLRDAADRLRLPPPKSQARSPEPEAPAAPLPPPPPPPQDAAAVAATNRPWKLRGRKRRSSARGGSTAASPATPWSAAAAEALEDGERAPFALALADEEIEDDIYSLTGARPRRRPRKRPRVVQRQLDSLLPGMWLTEITADDYRVPDD